MINAQPMFDIVAESNDLNCTRLTIADGIYAALSESS